MESTVGRNVHFMSLHRLGQLGGQARLLHLSSNPAAGRWKRGTQAAGDAHVQDDGNAGTGAGAHALDAARPLQAMRPEWDAFGDVGRGSLCPAVFAGRRPRPRSWHSRSY
jgi:hypothetical protein